MSEYVKRYGVFKLVFLGESAVGKSSIIQRFTRNIFDEYQNATIGAAFISRVFAFVDDENKTINKIKYEIWDTAGQERYKSLTPMYYRNANIAVIVFDLTEKQSFEKAKDWVKELQLFCQNADSSLEEESNNLLMILVGNKLDLVEKDESKRAVAKEEIENFVGSNNFVYIETSAKTGTNVKNLFEKSIATKLPSEMFKVEGASKASTNNDFTVDLNEGVSRNITPKSSCCS